MKSYRKISFIETFKRIKLLKEFEACIVSYFENITYSGYGIVVEENDVAQELRVKINKRLDTIYHIISLAGIDANLHRSLTPKGGQFSGTINVIYSIFQLHRFQLPPQVAFDLLQRAIGVYENDRKSAFVRTLNPLFWIGLILDFFVSLPFKLLGRIGFDRQYIESTILAKMIKGFLYLFVIGVIIAFILHQVGWLQHIIDWIR